MFNKKNISTLLTFLITYYFVNKMTWMYIDKIYSLPLFALLFFFAYKKKSISILLTSIIVYYFCNYILGIIHPYNLLIYMFAITISILITCRYPLFFLFFIILLYEKFFQTYPFWILPWQFEDFSIYLLFMGIFLQLIMNKFKLKLGTNNYYFKYILLIFTVIIITTFIGSYLIFDQPINSLIFRARRYSLYFIFLYLCLAEFKIDQIDKYISCIVFVTIIINVLLIIDAKIVGTFFVFKYAAANGVSGTRGGNVRIAVISLLTVFTYFYLLSTIKFNKKLTIKFLSMLGMTVIMYQIVFVLMTKQIFIPVILTTIIFLTTTKNLISKIFFFSIISVFLLSTAIFFLNNQEALEQSTYYKIIERTKSDIKNIDEENPIATRVKGIKFFFQYFKQTGFLGMGMNSSTNESSPIYKGGEQGYGFTDLGFFAIFFRFGIFSVILIIVILNRVFKDLIFIQKNSDTKHKILANSTIYFFISSIIFLPALKIFFYEQNCLYYGIFFYIIYKLKSEIILQNTQNSVASV